jgi:hypothetical protein
MARAPLSLEKLASLPSQGKVSYTSDFNPAEVKRILRHLIKIGCPPPGLDPALLN